MSDDLLKAVVVDAVHLHAEFTLELEEADATIVERASDHDPLIAVFDISP